MFHVFHGFQNDAVSHPQQNCSEFGGLTTGLQNGNRQARFPATRRRVPGLHDDLRLVK